MANVKQQSKQPEKDEHATFTSALAKVLSVPHSEINAKISDEKRVRKLRKK